MRLQVEITTRCNFDCFYCAGRLMRQADMSYELFTSILDHHIDRHGVPTVVSLQGEGEPTLHHDLFRMAAYVREVGARPYTITNGTYKHPERFAGLFPEVGVSIDTLDESAARGIGRYNLSRVLKFARAVAVHSTVIVHSVEHPEHTAPIAAWCRRSGYRHEVQPLQTKPDYSRRYPLSVTPSAAEGRFSCTYLSKPVMRYFSLDGMEMPCCYIKDTSTFEGMDNLFEHQGAGTWPRCCVGCRNAGIAAEHAPSGQGR
jgi:MoaA/NifB/PqqE/SkfB family radical SAM enzyme